MEINYVVPEFKSMSQWLATREMTATARDKKKPVERE